MSGGLLVLLALLVGALVIAALLRARTRPSVDAGPKAPGHDPSDPALSPLVETQGAPAGMAHRQEKDPVRRELDARERGAAVRPE